MQLPMTQSNEPTIESMNDEIARFSGATIDELGNVKFSLPADGIGLAGCGKHALRYHTSWDWLMPVVEKIKKLIDAENDLGMRHNMRSRWKPIENELCNINISNVHYCVYKFLKWKNEALATPASDRGMCIRCKISKATIDYNGHGHWVCDHCDEILSDEFDQEYR